MCFSDWSFMLCCVQSTKQDDNLLDELRSDNEFLRLRLNEHDSLHKEREETLNETIKNLQSSLHKHQNNVQASSNRKQTKRTRPKQKIVQLEKDLQDETDKRKSFIAEKW